MNTRSNILLAAFSAFGENGYAATTMQAIRKKAGISNGSLFHFFPNKESLGATLYIESILQYQSGLLNALSAPNLDAHAGIHALVRYHFDWVESHVQLARFLFERDLPDWGASHTKSIRSANHHVYRVIGEWLNQHMQAGKFKSQPISTCIALLQGSTLVLSRAWLENAIPEKLKRHIAPLSDALWAALRSEQESSS